MGGDKDSQVVLFTGSTRPRCPRHESNVRITAESPYGLRLELSAEKAEVPPARIERAHEV
jgi:hypothetical protein